MGLSTFAIARPRYGAGDVPPWTGQQTCTAAKVVCRERPIAGRPGLRRALPGIGPAGKSGPGQ